MSKFSETLKELIFERGIDYKTFAAAVDISACRITEYIRNEKLPTVENLVKIADYFGCSTDFLLGREEENSQLAFKHCPPFYDRIEYLKNYFKCSSYKIYHGTGITKSRYYEWKNGKRQPTLDNVIKLADLFDCRVDFVLGREI